MSSKEILLKGSVFDGMVLVVHEAAASIEIPIYEDKAVFHNGYHHPPVSPRVHIYRSSADPNVFEYEGKGE